MAHKEPQNPPALHRGGAGPRAGLADRILADVQRQGPAQLPNLDVGLRDSFCAEAMDGEGELGRHSTAPVLTARGLKVVESRTSMLDTAV